MLQCTQTGPQEIPVNDCTINLFIIMHYYDLLTPISCKTDRQTGKQRQKMTTTIIITTITTTQ